MSNITLIHFIFTLWPSHECLRRHLYKPLWTVDPDTSVIEAISRRHLFPHADSAELTVKFMAEGAFNKVYTVDTKTISIVKSYIFRATLPVTKFKMKSLP
jgi:hypothetical protein